MVVVHLRCCGMGMGVLKLMSVWSDKVMGDGLLTVISPKKIKLDPRGV